MKIYQFYKNGRCQKYAALEQVVSEENRHKKLRKVLKSACTLYAGGSNEESILLMVKNELDAYYENYDFSFEWQKEMFSIQDLTLFQRLFLWIATEKLTPVKALVSTSFAFTDGQKLTDGTNQLEGLVHLIMKGETGKYHALIIHTGQSERSMKGKSVWTNAACDLEALVAKHYLEPIYPEIEIDMIYLSSHKDMPGAYVEQFEESATAHTNIHRLVYADFYEDKHFEQEKFFQKMLQVIEAKPKTDCKECKMDSLCNTPKMNSTEKEAVNQVSGYQMPNFTKDQLKVVHHIHGPLRVCAGPGSGKTATLIGRIKHMVDAGIAPEFMLVVTFTNEAANELADRCRSFLSEDMLPKIATLNGFCYQILRENEALLSKSLKVLSTVEKMKLIQAITSVYPPLKGFKYGMEYGKNGVYKTISNRLDFYFKCASKEAFFQKYPDCGDDFIDFANQYQAVIEDGGYITFEEQISLCNELFATHPDILHVYQSLYRYIMVDEYQDVNKDQVDMLYSLAKDKNLVVVGDDDQGIYGFRGASATYMIDFIKDFPEAKTVILRDNFRSTNALVDASSRLIANNQNRIVKQIRSGKQSEKNTLPIVVPTTDTSTIENIVSKLTAQGYQYSDIAILATKNAPLEQYHKTLSFPTVLAKSHLKNDCFFLLLYNALNLYKNLNDDRSFFQYLKLFGFEYYHREKGLSLAETLFAEYGIRFDSGNPHIPEGCPMAEAICMLRTYLRIINISADISSILDVFMISCNWTKSNAMEVLLDEAKKQGIETIEDLHHYMEYLIKFEADIRVEVSRENKVMLITSHDSKGKEFKVVLLVNDYSGTGEEVRRLFYVAMTRPKEQLYILQDKDAKCDFLNEIPHTKWEVAL